jgi:hypothetical protein
MSRFSKAVVIVCAALALTACGERPERADPEGPRAWSNDKPQNPLHERARNQGESDRMGI